MLFRSVPVVRYGMDTGDPGPKAGVNAPFPGGVTTLKVPRGAGHVTENWLPFLGAAVAIGAARAIATAATPPATAILLLFVIRPPPGSARPIRRVESLTTRRSDTLR